MCSCTMYTDGQGFPSHSNTREKAKESLYRGLVVYVCPIIHINSKSANMNTSILTVFLIVCVGRSLWEAIVSSVMPPVRTH